MTTTVEPQQPIFGDDDADGADADSADADGCGDEAKELGSGSNSGRCGGGSDGSCCCCGGSCGGSCGGGRGAAGAAD